MKLTTCALSLGALIGVGTCVAACGGGPAAGSPGSMTPDTAVAMHKAAAKKGQLKIDLRIPREKRKHHKFRPGYISAATQSMTVSVTGQAVQTFNLTPNSSGCSAASGYTTCDVSAFFPSGQQTITVTLYDQTNGQGNVLSKGTASANIVAGSTTYISITLEGVVASVVVLVDGSTTVSVPEGIATSLPITVSAYDADGKLIIAPGGYDTTTPVTLSDGDTSGITAVAPTSIPGPGTTATLSYTGGAISSAIITANVKGVAQANPVTLTVVSTPSPSPSPTPTASPTPMPRVSPASLSFSSGATQTFTVQETNYSGTLSASSGDTTVATVSPASANGPTAAFTVQPISGGTTAIAVTDALGNTVKVNISVNGGVIVIDQVPTANPSSLSFDTSASQMFNVHENEYYGVFAESDTCSGIASVSSSSPNGPTATFTVTPVNGGTCSVTLADAQGNTTGVGISVTAGSITVNGKRGKRTVRGGR